MVDAALPGIAPKFLQAVPLCEDDPAGGDYLLLMEDCCPGRRATLTRLSRPGPQSRGPGFICNACCKPSRRCTGGSGLVGRIDAARNPPGAERARAGAGPDPGYRRARHPPVAPRLRFKRTVARALPEPRRPHARLRRPLEPQQPARLVHGDFHFDNVVIGRQGRPVLADWGAAAIANPCWDLAFCGPAEVAVYCAAIRTGAGPQPRYCGEDHRAAVAVRMLLLAGAALAVTQEPQRRRLGAALPSSWPVSPRRPTRVPRRHRISRLLTSAIAAAAITRAPR